MPKNRRLLVAITEEMADALRERKRQTGAFTSEFCRRAIQKALNAEKTNAEQSKVEHAKQSQVQDLDVLVQM